ncbi:hypothetical protein EDD86DRAFT_202337 [Gorgonomyces haynaldii]|nr:hypothetical protein EDD86DRAFT_202337 [Gorgonomyces haynaldii]
MSAIWFVWIVLPSLIRTNQDRNVVGSVSKPSDPSTDPYTIPGYNRCLIKTSRWLSATECILTNVNPCFSAGGGTVLMTMGS